MGNHELDDRARCLVERLAGNRRDGASAMCRQALHLLDEYLSTARDARAALRNLPALRRALATARPSMGAIARVLEVWHADSVGTGGAGASIAAARAAIRRTQARMDRATEETVRRAAEQLREVRRWLTHSASGVVEQSFAAVGPWGHEVVLTRSLPGGEGEALAGRLQERGFVCTVVDDGVASRRIRGVDAVVTGADAVLPGGDVVNKVGTSQLARAAHDAGVPVFIVAESFKRLGGDVPLERGDDGALLFDRTPARWITRWVRDTVFDLSGPDDTRGEPLPGHDA